MSTELKIEVKCFATLAEYTPQGGRTTVAKGLVVRDVVKKLGIPSNEVKIIFVNGEQADWDRAIESNDRIGIFPAVGGG